MNPKTIAVLLMLACPFIIFGIVYVFGWLLTLFAMLFGISVSAARIIGVALSIVIAVMVINYQAHQ
ncbi:hypothetical protein QMA60_09035 [Leuconostoc suionicum]|uniref:hypothetical protein n=1 Tax=Leuconostoc suionicum TaxID=1511761 RepID=UPI0024AE7F4F|nr:hypothetical protein [Leuconostoc suionicum]MDI6497885.1 hypothetical protein [Leuconostoc suionicum]MDI6499966.1 hypothetical protein [Leuconostoc suionicum]MDI6502903.1 hypothetical protein [Leuconostoc suionicum]MDI6665762.1 hypothetical protein [Leuconostoc suionicum]